MKLILGICTVGFHLFLCYLLLLVLDYIRGRSEGKKYTAPIFNYFRKMCENRLVFPTLMFFLVLMGACNIMLSITHSSTQIGSFYEKATYKECYEATIYVNGKPIYCLAEIQKNAKVFEKNNYCVERIYLPYEKKIDLSSEYDPNLKKNYLDLGYTYVGNDCYIVLRHPASSSSYDLLSFISDSNSGSLCASREGSIMHFPDCYYAKNITSKNLIFFESEDEARLFGYELCDKCYNNMIKGR